MEQEIVQCVVRREIGLMDGMGCDMDEMIIILRIDGDGSNQMESR